MNEDGRPFIATHGEAMYGMRAAVHWADGGYAVEAWREDVARWIGFRVSGDEEVKVIWWGTQKTTRGTFAAQFTIENED